MNPFLFLSFCFLSVGAAHADQAQFRRISAPKLVKAAVAVPELSVSIAVPEAGKIRRVRLSTEDPHLDVIIRNVSTQPEEFFTETCSAGYDTLHLEILSIDDKVLSEPIIVKRSVSSWDSNIISTVTLPPGDSMVREVHFTEDRGFFGILYQNFPAMKAGEIHVFRMQAVFEVQAGNRHSTLWTGRAVSTPQDYRVEQYVP